MFEFLSLFARQPFSQKRASRRRFRKLDTTRGSYFIDWRPETVKALLAEEALCANDFREGSPGDLHRLTRDLLLLGLQDEMESGRRSPIAGLARSLMRRKRQSEASPTLLLRQLDAEGLSRAAGTKNRTARDPSGAMAPRSSGQRVWTPRDGDIPAPIGSIVS